MRMRKCRGLLFLLLTCYTYRERIYKNAKFSVIFHTRNYTCKCNHKQINIACMRTPIDHVFRDPESPKTNYAFSKNKRKTTTEQRRS